MKYKLYQALIWTMGPLSILILGVFGLCVLLLAAVFKCMCGIMGATYQARKVQPHPRYWSRRRY